MCEVAWLCLDKTPSGCRLGLFLLFESSWKGFSKGKEGCLLIAPSHEYCTAGLATKRLLACTSLRLFATSLSIDRAAGSGGQIVAMMQTIEPRHRYNFAAGSRVLRCFTTVRRSLRQSEMRPVIVEIADVLIHQALQVSLVHINQMIEQVSTTVANPTLGDAVLPRTSGAGALGLDAEALHCVDHFFIEVCTAIEDREFRSRVVGECLAELLNNPCTAGMLGDVTAKDSPPIMRDDEEAVQHAESERWNCDPRRTRRRPVLPGEPAGARLGDQDWEGRRVSNADRRTVRQTAAIMEMREWPRT